MQLKNKHDLCAFPDEILREVRPLDTQKSRSKQPRPVRIFWGTTATSASNIPSDINYLQKFPTFFYSNQQNLLTATEPPTGMDVEGYTLPKKVSYVRHQAAPTSLVQFSNKYAALQEVPDEPNHYKNVKVTIL